MNFSFRLWCRGLVCVLALAVTTVFAQTAPDMATGEVRKVDTSAGKITIRHGEIRSIDMPPMTMVFVMKDPQALSSLKVGDKVQFAVVEQAGKFVVTDIKLAP